MNSQSSHSPGGPDRAVKSGEGRKEVGGQQSSSRNPPHATQNDVAADQIQDESSSRKTVPSMPANAGGSDRIPTDDQDQGIDPASMYDRRPGEHKDRPPSSNP